MVTAADHLWRAFGVLLDGGVDRVEQRPVAGGEGMDVGVAGVQVDLVVAARLADLLGELLGDRVPDDRFADAAVGDGFLVDDRVARVFPGESDDRHRETVVPGILELLDFLVDGLF
ncbi:hypothetical protein [Amycolatopsis sp. M39]|uniref:hypothetical protein n=1 Tax=Amycolatopsis sp. M39 TaxID=1825094 RepID=UPI0012FF8900|nr:hypothetical protein [Amycolatopsis sp. M39]